MSKNRTAESLLIEESFGELFEAARMLLREGVTEEERIVPTLALANDVRMMWSLAAERKRLVEAWKDHKLWEREAATFAWKHPGLKPVGVLGGILLLEQLPVYVYVHDPVYEHEWGREQNADDARRLQDREVVIGVFPHSRPATREQVSAAYKKALSDAGVAYEESNTTRSGSLRIEYRGGYVLVLVEHIEKTLPASHRQAGNHTPVFPHPQQVGEHYGLLMGTSSGSGFASRLATRKRGYAPESLNLVPACVSFYLRTRLTSQKQIHKVLNEHVLCQTWKKLPEDGVSSSAANQLWRDTQKVGKRLVAASHPLHYSEPEWMFTHNTFLPKKLF